MAEVLAESGHVPDSELFENLINEILKDDDLLILTNDIQDEVTLMATIEILPSEFAVRGDQLLQLEVNVLVEEAK